MYDKMEYDKNIQLYKNESHFPLECQNQCSVVQTEGYQVFTKIKAQFWSLDTSQFTTG